MLTRYPFITTDSYGDRYLQLRVLVLHQNLHLIPLPTNLPSAMVQECVDSYRIPRSAVFHSSFLWNDLPVRPYVFAVGPRNTWVLHQLW